MPQQQGRQFTDEQLIEILRDRATTDNDLRQMQQLAPDDFRQLEFLRSSDPASFQPDPKASNGTLLRLAQEFFQFSIPNPNVIAEQVGFSGGVGPMIRDVAQADSQIRGDLREQGSQQIATGMAGPPVQQNFPEGTTAPGPGAGATRNLVEGAGRIAAGSIPLEGPTGAMIGDTFTEKGVPEGIGATLGAISSFGVGALMRRLRTSRGEPFGAIAGAENVPLTPSQVESGLILPKLKAGTTRFESFLERSSFGAGPATARLRVVKERISQMARDTFDEISAPLTGNAIEDGERVSQAAQRFIRESFNAAGQEIEQMLAIYQGVPASRRSTKVLARRMLRELNPTLQGQGGILPESMASGDMGLLRGIINSDDMTDVVTLFRERSVLLDITRRSGKIVGDPSDAKIKQMTSTIDSAMIAGIRRQGGAAAARQARDTLSAWGQLRQIVDGAVEDMIIKTDRPEAIGSVLMAAGSRTIKNVKQAMPEDAYNLAIRSGLEDLFRKATTGELVAEGNFSALERRMFGGAAIETFDPDAFANRLENIGKANLDLMIGRDASNALVELAQFTKKATRPGGLTEMNVGAPRLVAAALDSSVVFGFLGGSAIGGLPGGAAGAAGVAGTINFLSRAWFNPRKRRLIQSGMKAIANNNGGMATFFANALDDMLSDEERRMLRGGELPSAPLQAGRVAPPGSQAVTVTRQSPPRR